MTKAGIGTEKRGAAVTNTENMDTALNGVMGKGWKF